MHIRSPYILIALTGVVLAASACQHQRSQSLLPPRQASAPALAAAATPPEKPRASEPKPAPPAQVQPEPKPDPIADLIVKVEKEYQAGQDSYKANNFDAAKQSFERAFHLLLDSGLDVHSDQRLQSEFDRVLEGMSWLELQASLQGQDSAEQKSEPAPIDEDNEVTFP